MRDVYAIFGTLLALGIAFPGWLFAWWLLFPQRVEQASQQISQHGRRSFFWGLLSTIGVALPALILANIPIPFAKLMAAIIGLLAFAVAAMGAAGIVWYMAQRLQARSQGDLSAPAAFIRAAIALELAAAFPLIGWLLVVPVTVMLAFGGAILSLRHRSGRAPEATLQPPLTIEVS